LWYPYPVKEREISDITYGGGEREAELSPGEKQAYLQCFTEGIEEEIDRGNPVAKSCKYVRFLSISRGRGRERRYPLEIELFCYSGRWRAIINGVEAKGIDCIATEVLGDSVPPEECTKIFLEKLRKLGKNNNARR